MDGEYEPSPRRWVRDQVRLYEASGGTEGTTLGNAMLASAQDQGDHQLEDSGLPVVIITHVGAKTGKVRKTPLMRVEHHGLYAAVASQGGSPKNPLWYFNLIANPRVELQDGAERSARIARELSGDEREVWWERAVAAYPWYADYQADTARLIPVFVLEPILTRR